MENDEELPELPDEKSCCLCSLDHSRLLRDADVESARIDEALNVQLGEIEVPYFCQTGQTQKATGKCEPCGNDGEYVYVYHSKSNAQVKGTCEENSNEFFRYDKKRAEGVFFDLVEK